MAITLLVGAGFVLLLGPAGIGAVFIAAGLGLCTGFVILLIIPDLWVLLFPLLPGPEQLVLLWVVLFGFIGFGLVAFGLILVGLE